MESEILGFGIWNAAQGILILPTTGIQNLSSTDKLSEIQYLAGIYRIHGTECRIQDCHGFPFIG